MKEVKIQRATQRGGANHGWLSAKHSFSFADYYDTENMNFGALRVLNDDIVQGGRGFSMHAHDNMEIITIPLQGALRHKDNMGNEGVVSYGEVQVMSAGTGVMHSEANANLHDEVKLLQIWLFPREQNVTPRYDQITLDPQLRINDFQQILSPFPEDEGTWIHQDAWFYLGEFNQDKDYDYSIKRSGNGVYIFVIEGMVDCDGALLNARDALGISGVEDITLHIQAESKVLIMDVPMIISNEV